MRRLAPTTSTRHRVGLHVFPFVVLALLLGLSGLTAQAKSQHRVAIVIPGSVRFFDVQIAAMRTRARQLDVKLTILNADWSARNQLDLVATALRGGYDVVALAAVDTKVVRHAAELARDGTPLLTFTNAISASHGEHPPDVAGYVGRDEFQAGELLGQEVQSLGLASPRVLLIEGAPGTAPQQLRSEGYLAVAERNGWPAPTRIAIDGWNLDSVESRLAELMHDPSQFDVIATHWADAAVAASRYLRSIDRTMPIVTLEWTNSLVNEMKMGNIQSSTYFSVRAEGTAVIDAAVHLIDHPGEPVNHTIDQVIVTRQQADRHAPEW